MKKFLAILLSVLLSLSMIACGKAGDSQISSQKSEQKNLTIVRASKNNKLNAYNGEPTNKRNGLTAEYVENVENKYYVYYFYLGLIKQVPAYSSVALKYSYDTEVTLNFNSLTEESLSNTVSKAEETIDTHSYTGGFAFGFEQEMSVKMGVVFNNVKANFKTTQSTDHHWTDNWGKTISESNSTTSSYVNSYSNGYEEKVLFSEEAGFVKGNYYRMSFYETVKAYGVLIYDVEEEKYAASSQTFLQSNSTIRLWEESQDGVYNYEETENLDFDIANAILYAQENPPVQVESGKGNENTDLPETQKISVTMNRYNCNDGNNYNKNEPEESADWRSRHNGYEIGQLNLYGCQQVKEGYKIGEPNKFAIRYQVLQNIDDLPRVGTDLTHVENDDATSVKGTNISSRVGYGAYWVRITYTNDSQIQYNKTNILKYATNGTIIDIVTQDNIDITKTIKKIEIVVVYELYAGAAGFLGIWWHEYSNWRCEYTYEFM